MEISEPVDQVKRLRHLQAEYPKWQVISPRDIRSVARNEVEWRALGPDGQLIRERELSDLIDEIETHLGGTQ